MNLAKSTTIASSSLHHHMCLYVRDIAKQRTHARVCIYLCADNMVMKLSERENTNAKCFACQHMWKIVHHLTALFGMANRLVRDECGMGGGTSDVFCVHDFPAPIRPPALLDSLRIIRPSSEHARIISSGRGCCVGAMHWQDMTAQDQAPLLYIYIISTSHSGVDSQSE